ncbi:MAG: apolipoprotein N-acyltransferase [Elusimicrobiota bacterium]
MTKRPLTRPFPPVISLIVVVLAGAALGLCLPKPGLTAFAWFAPAILLWRLRVSRSPLASFGLGWAFGAAFCGVALHWIYLTCRFAGLSVPVSAAALAGLCALLGFNWGVFAFFSRVFIDRLPGWLQPWSLAALLAAIESACAAWTPRLGFDLLAYTQWPNLFLLQGSAVFGPHALGFLILLWNASWESFLRDRAKTARINLGLCALLLAAWASYGTFILSKREIVPGRAVEIIQPNIDQYRKWDADSAPDIRRTIEELMSRERKDAPALILWPESSVPGWLDDPDNSQWAASLARQAKAPVLLGSVTRMGSREHNSAVLFSPKGEPSAIYHKRQLVPFGEFVPLRAWLQGAVPLLEGMWDMEPGQAAQMLMATPLGPLAVNICYESVFPRWVRLDASRGARVAANLTNDGWYKDTWGPLQHFQVNVFRAIESRITVLRAGNTGVSAVIDPYGRVLARGPFLAPARLEARLNDEGAFPKGSFYSRHGDWFGFLCIAAVACLVFLLSRKTA